MNYTPYTGDGRMAEYGHITYSGRVMDDRSVDRYNALTRKIEAFKSAGMTVSEVDLKDRHSILVACALYGDKPA